MKLVIQIPCFNEAAHLPATIADLPRRIDGIDGIEVLVIDDGSTDGTADVARSLGAHVVSVPHNRGLAHTFMLGLEQALLLGADIVVNTDADNQYAGADIAKLVAPILANSADFVIGARPIRDITSFSTVKKWLQRLGSWTVRRLSGTDVSDATSGFRAMNRAAALRLNVFSRYTYTLETIIQAEHHELRVASVPVRVNPPTRPSRLVRSNLDYVWRTGSAMVRVFVVYRPFRSFMWPAAVLALAGLAIALRFVYFYIAGDGLAGHVQSLILAAILFGLAGTLAAVAFVGELLSINRRLLESLCLDARLRQLERQRERSADG